MLFRNVYQELWQSRDSSAETLALGLQSPTDLWCMETQELVSIHQHLTADAEQEGRGQRIYLSTRLLLVFFSLLLGVVVIR